MKSYKEWKKENINEFFGLGKKPSLAQQTNVPTQAIAGSLHQPKKLQTCPFCKTQTVERRSDSSYYPTSVQVHQCIKCFKYWDDESLDPNKARDSVGLIENNNYILYLSGLISEDFYFENLQQPNTQPNNQQLTDINQIASQMQFLPTSKKKLMYQFSQDVNNMKPMSYGVAQQHGDVVTMTSDGKETQNTAEPNDIIMSGPSGEKYVIKSAKFPKLYMGQIGQPIHPEQSPRNVAVYTGNNPINFTAPWGESMVLKPGDYLVKEAEGKYYRIAKKEYEMTYNPPGKIG